MRSTTPSGTIWFVRDTQRAEAARALTDRLVGAYLKVGEQSLFKAYGVLSVLPGGRRLGFGWLVVTNTRIHSIDAVTSRPFGAPWPLDLLVQVDLRDGIVVIDGHVGGGQRIIYGLKMKLEASAVPFLRDVRHVVAASQRWDA